MKEILSGILMFLLLVFGMFNPSFAYETVTGPHWGKSTIDVYIPKNVDGSSVRHAFTAWQNKSGEIVRFNFVSNGPADIDVVFLTSGKSSSHVLKTKGNVITKAEIKIPVSKNLSRDYVYTAALHEVGHSLGLSDDSRKPSVIMHSPVSVKQELTKLDIRRLYKLYGQSYNTRRFN